MKSSNCDCECDSICVVLRRAAPCCAVLCRAAPHPATKTYISVTADSYGLGALVLRFREAASMNLRKYAFLQFDACLQPLRPAAVLQIKTFSVSPERHETAATITLSANWTHVSQTLTESVCE